jgi:Flp pilus assembly protein TadD
VDSLGWVLYRLGRLDEAIRYLRRALALKADPEVAAHLGEVLWVAGDREGAKEVWSTALKAQPEDKRLLDVMQRFGL